MNQTTVDKPGPPLDQTVFSLTAAIVLGMAAYRLLHYWFSGIAFRIHFRGHALEFEGMFTALGILTVGALGVLLLIVWARRGKPPVEDKAEIERRACPECRSLIPAAARRCAYCRQQVQPQDEQGDTQI